ncbi:MAG: nuclear transport factor 2 family protein, partial [Rhodospirillales bacterium]|nr:nuclear transport factor 2 family protein [Rhodospirillales bacterium]
MSDQITALFANEAFYAAFASRDLEAMAVLWAEEAPVTCIHPGWKALFGRPEVLESWSSILANPDSPDVEFHGARATLYGAIAIVTCIEQVENTFLAATNIFLREKGDWKLIHHQSGPGQPPDES